MISFFELDPNDGSEDALVGLTMTRKEAHVLAALAIMPIWWSSSSPIIAQVAETIWSLITEFNYRSGYEYRYKLCFGVKELEEKIFDGRYEEDEPVEGGIQDHARQQILERQSQR